MGGRGRWRPEAAWPVISLADIRKFDHAFLFSNLGVTKEAEATRDALASKWATPVEVRQIPLSDPTDYGAIILGLREHIPRITVAFPDADHYVFASPGTPQMQASFMLFVMAGLLDAKFLQLPGKRFGGHLRVLNFGSEGFPDVRVWFRDEEIGKIDEDALPALARSDRDYGVAPRIQGNVEESGLVCRIRLPDPVAGRVRFRKGACRQVCSSDEQPTRQTLHRLQLRRRPGYPCGRQSFRPRPARSSRNANRDGLLKSADGGVLFLDEIAEMPLTVQPKLLRVLQDGKFTPLGTDKETTVNVRIVSGTHQDLKEKVKKGEFRKDLLYRLNSCVIEIPPLLRRIRISNPWPTILWRNSIKKTARNLR